MKTILLLSQEMLILYGISLIGFIAKRIIPLLLFPGFLLPIPFAILAVAVLLSASPSAPTTTLFAQQFKGDVYFASIGVFLSTILALLTIPFIYSLLLWISG